MIVDLDTLKLALDIAETDTTDDSILTDLEQRAADFVEEQTGRRWSTPTTRVEYVQGTGTRILYLGGHIDTTVEQSGDAPIIALRQRAIAGGEWDDVDSTDFERRADTLVRLDGSAWSRVYEYEATYLDGYVNPPGDIVALVIDLVSISFGAGTGAEGVKSESIGDYSYSLDSAVTAAASSMTDTSVATMNRRRRVRI